MSGTTATAARNRIGWRRPRRFLRRPVPPLAPGAASKRIAASMSSKRNSSPILVRKRGSPAQPCRSASAASRAGIPHGGAFEVAEAPHDEVLCHKERRRDRDLFVAGEKTVEVERRVVGEKRRQTTDDGAAKPVEDGGGPQATRQVGEGALEVRVVGGKDMLHSLSVKRLPRGGGMDEVENGHIPPPRQGGERQPRRGIAGRRDDPAVSLLGSLAEEGMGRDHVHERSAIIPRPHRVGQDEAAPVVDVDPLAPEADRFFGGVKRAVDRHELAGVVLRDVGAGRHHAPDARSAPDIVASRSQRQDP